MLQIWVWRGVCIAGRECPPRCPRSPPPASREPPPGGSLSSCPAEIRCPISDSCPRFLGSLREGAPARRRVKENADITVSTFCGYQTTRQTPISHNYAIGYLNSYQYTTESRPLSSITGDFHKDRPPRRCIFEKQFITKFSKTLDKLRKMGYNKYCRVLRI